jgi:opacity protein-like surface antigen
MKIKFITLATAALFSTASLAQSPTWNLIEAGYGQADIDGLDELSPSGFAIGGSSLLGENVFIQGSYSLLSDDISGVDIDLDQASVGLGYRYGLTETTDVYASASYEYIELSASGFGASESLDDSGYGLTVGLRSRITEQLELNGAIGYVDIGDESETALGVSGHYYFTQNVALGLTYSSTADVSIYGISLRYAF